MLTMFADDGDEYGGYDGDYNYGTDDCLGDEYTCPSDGFCIQSSMVCDGFKDCADGSDENCTESTTAVSSTATTEDYSYPACGSNEFHCGGGICTALANVCNGIKECPNGLDEEDCDYVDYEACSPEEFKCQNGVCIHKSALCDGIHDCDDGSDENNCTARSTEPSVVSTTASDYYDYDDCEGNEFHCGSGVCIPTTSLCDNVHDCHDGSDETDCPFNKDNTTSSTPRSSSNLIDVTTHAAATTATPTHDSTTLSATDKQCLYEGARYPAGVFLYQQSSARKRHSALLVTRKLTFNNSCYKLYGSFLLSQWTTFALEE
ncbi:unnamed protein product [Clavelina lepadiformis]|uniref:Uncharacterized protein n=1 Tax=Clavelina lepadiformis TaxID=159417 RepID=A0ABP0FUD7_CLALP